MSTEQEKSSGRKGEPDKPVQQPKPPGDAHAGHGSDSAMKQLRVWEQRRAVNSVGKGRPGPH